MSRCLFHHAVVNDLAAALNQPSLMTPSREIPCFQDVYYEQVWNEAKPWLQKLDKDPSALLSHIQKTPRHNRLGLYYEALLSFWLLEHPTWKLLAHELPVYDNKTTVGAYDFLVETATDIIHIEVAVKYYMGIEGLADWRDWIGPGQKDSLKLKMNKMLSKQLHLSRLDAGKAALTSAGLPQPTLRRMWFKGIFFSPHDTPLKQAPLGGREPTGVWYPMAAIPSLITQYPRGYWMPRIKPDWLANLNIKDLPAKVTPPAKLESVVKKQFAENGNAPAMWSLMLPDVKVGWREVQRFFFAPNDWRHRAKQR